MYSDLTGVAAVVAAGACLLLHAVLTGLTCLSSRSSACAHPGSAACSCVFVVA